MAMLKLVLGDYRCRFLSELKKYIQMIVTFGWLVIFYMVILHTDVILYLTGMVPVMIGLLLSRMFPNHLDKWLFLCPLSVQDRKKYLMTAYLVRVGIPGLLYASVSVSLAVIGYISGTVYVQMSALVISYLLGANMHHAFLSLRIVRRLGEKDALISFIYGVLSLFSLIIVWIAVIFVSTIGSHGLEPYMDVAIFKNMVLVEVVINVVLCVICYRPVMQHGIHYESCQMLSREGTKQHENCD